MRKHRLLAAVVIIVLGCTVGATAKAEGKAKPPIKIGVVDTFSGSLAALGTDHLRGAQIAVQEINQAGGLLGGRKVVLSTQDDQATSQVALQALRTMHDDGIHLLMAGGTSSAVCQDETALLGSLQELQISPGCAVNTLTGPSVVQNFFRTSENVNSTVAATVGGVCKNFPGIKRVDTLELDVASAASGVGLAGQLFSKDCGGAQVVNRVKVPSTATDFLSYLTDLNTHLASDSAQHSALYVWIFGAPEITAFKEGVALGLFNKYKVVFSNVNDINNVADALGSSMPPVYATLYWYPGAWNKPQDTQFIADFTKKFGTAPDSSSGEGYNAIRAYAAAITKANSDNYVKVRSALGGLQFKTLQGRMVINKTTHQGDVTEAIVLFSNKTPKVTATVHP